MTLTSNLHSSSHWPTCKIEASAQNPESHLMCVRPCYWHSPSRQRLLYFLYALTASSLRTKTTSATPTFTSRARFKAPHTQNSSWTNRWGVQTHTECVITALQHSAHRRISSITKLLLSISVIYLQLCLPQWPGDAGCSLWFLSPPEDWKQARKKQNTTWSSTCN